MGSELTHKPQGRGRVAVRQQCPSEDSAIVALRQLADKLHRGWKPNETGADAQILELHLVNDCTRGQRYELEIVFVDQEYRHRKRQQAGRHS